MNPELPDDGSAAFHRYIAEIEAFPRLYADHEQATMEKAEQGDESAVRALVEANLRFVVRIAEIYAGQGLPLPTLVRIGNAALIDAAHNPRPARSSGFRPHTVWRIRQAMLQALASPGPTPEPPPGFAVGRWHQLLLEAEAAAPDTGHPRSDLKPLPFNEHQLEDFIQNARQNLTDLQVRVLTLYFGFASEAISIDAIAQQLGMSADDVRAVRDDAFARLRQL